MRILTAPICSLGIYHGHSRKNKPGRSPTTGAAIGLGSAILGSLRLVARLCLAVALRLRYFLHRTRTRRNRKIEAIFGLLACTDASAYDARIYLLVRNAKWKL